MTSGTRPAIDEITARVMQTDSLQQCSQEEGPVVGIL